MSRTFFIPFLMVLLVSVANPGLATNSPTIDLDTAVYFLSPGEDVVLVEPGTYEMEATEEWLRLIPQGDERNQALLLTAQAVTHTEILNAPRALSLGGEQDIHMVALFLPDGSGLWMMGSYSGIQTRSGKAAQQAQRRFLQRKMDVLRQQNKVLMQQQSDIPINQSFNLQYLQLQQRMQADNRQFNLLSSIMKTKHDTAKAAVGNIR